MADLLCCETCEFCDKSQLLCMHPASEVRVLSLYLDGRRNKPKNCPLRRIHGILLSEYGKIRQDIKDKNMKMNPCSKCGSTPVVRYQLPYNWVQCKCGNCSKAFPDYYDQHDLDSIKDAVSDWNSKNKVAK